MLCIVFYLNLQLNIFLNIYFYFILIPAGTCVNIKKLCMYPHNGYLTDIDTSTEHIFIQRVRYERATTYTLPVRTPLTSLVTTENFSHPS